MTQISSERGHLDCLFRPKSIAVVGASSDPSKIGGRPVALLKRMGFTGAIYPINPMSSVIQDLPTYPAIRNVPESPDLAMVVLPSRLAPAAVEACISHGVRAIILISAGFGEIDDTGRAIQAELAERCSAAGVRLLGPNCLGVVNVQDRVACTHSAALDFAWPSLGRLGIVTQSGAVGSYCYALAVDRGLGLSTFVATGNEADIDVADCIAWMAEDDQTSVILGYLEGCRDGWRLRQALTAARQAGKPVILMKGGSSDAGAQAGASHTGSLAGADRVFDAAFRETGAYRANSIEEMIDVASGCIGLEGNFPTGRNLGIFTVSGGVGILMADAATEFNLSLPILSDAAEAKIKSLVPFATSRNPVDATAQILNDFTIMTSILRTMVEDRNFNIITLFLQDLGRLDQYVDRFREEIFAMKAERPSTTFLICGGFLPRVAREFRAHGFLIFEDPRRTVHMAAALATIGAGLKAADGSCLGYKLRSTARSADAAVDGTLDELQSRALLHQADIPFVPAEFAGSRGAAVAAAEAIGFPVVLKVVSKDVAHKSDVGGVAVFLADANAVEMAWDRVMKSVAKAVPDAVIDGALICAMVTEGTEVVMGVHRDPAFGPVAMFGLGGVFVEIFNDVSFGLTPLSKDSALSMIRNIKGFPLLQGARGKPGADIEQLADILCRLAAFAETNQDTISSVELNPILAGPRGAVAVDALVIRERNDARIR